MQLWIPHNLLVIGAEVLWSICHGASLVGHSLLHTLLGEPLQKIVLMKIKVGAAPDIRCWLLVQRCEPVNGGVGPFLVMPMLTCLCSLDIQWAWSSGRQGSAADNVQLPHCILFNGSSVTSCQHKSHHTMLSFTKRSGMNVQLRLTTWRPMNNTLDAD